MSTEDRLEAMEATVNIVVWVAAACMIISAAALIAAFTV